MVEVLRPRSLSDALVWLKDNNALPMAGGTDLMVRYRNYTGTASGIDRPVLFTDAIEEMGSVKVREEGLEIGSSVLLSELEFHKDVPELLRKALSTFASPALRNRATLGGNICNASPAGDSLPPLYVYDASLVLRSVSGERTVPIEQFITGPGQTDRASDELLTAIRIPLQGAEHIYYRKVGTRAANALSKLSIAGLVKIEKGNITDFRMALGAVGPQVLRSRECEKSLTGVSADQIEIDKVLKAYDSLIRPINDQRSTAEYRKTVALNLAGDFLKSIGDFIE